MKFSREKTRKYNAILSTELLLISLAFFTVFMLLTAESMAIELNLKTKAEKIKAVSALPTGNQGSDIRHAPDFNTILLNSKNGVINISINNEPIFIIEGDLPHSKQLSPDNSPFGFHPASGKNIGYNYAQDIGVVWDRGGGAYVMWILSQPNLNGGYIWRMYDRHFQEIPSGMRPLKNITVAFDGLVNVPNRPSPPRVEKPGRNTTDLSQYLDGTSYRPKDENAYSAWVRAAVERYDGDGIDDMPGLRVPAKHWQVDNEPPRGREGYTDLVRITSKAIKEADPEAKVLIGGLQLPCGDDRKIRNYYRTQLPLLQELKGQAVDIIDFHWFGFVGEWKMLPEAMKIVRKTLQESGFNDTPIWFTEMGTYSGKPNARRREIAAFQSERDQASEMIKRYTVVLSEGVEKIFWAWGMEEGFINERDNDFFDNTGFVYDGIGPNDPGKGTKKIIYYAHKKMTQLLQYWDGSIPEKIETGDNIYAYRFRFNSFDDRGIIIVWKGD